MIGGKLENGDVIVEVEDERADNIAPEVLPTLVYLGAITGNPVTENNSYRYDNRTKTVYPTWSYSKSSTDGRSHVFTANKKQDALLFKVGDLQLSGVVGQNYFTTIQFRQRPTAIPGNLWNYNMPVTRAVLYASNGNSSQDVIIAASGDLRGAQWDHWWDSVQYSRVISVELTPVQPMPAGKPYLKFGILCDSDYNVNAEIKIFNSTNGPEPNPWPVHIGLFESMSAPFVYYKNAAGDQWKAVSGTATYPADGEIAVSNNSGIRSTISIPADHEIKTKGGVFSCNTHASGNVTLTVTGGTSFTQTQTGPNPRWVIPASAFSGNNVTVTVGSQRLSNPQLSTNIGATDTDGYSYFTYEDQVDAVSAIEINRHDSEVGTCVVTLRNDTGLDLDETFIPGKRVRIRTNTLNGQYESVINGINVNPKNTVFTGVIHSKRVAYPRTARPEIKVTITDNYSALLQPNQYCMSALSNYRWMLPYYGIPSLVEGDYYPPQNDNDNVTYNGLWRFIDESEGMTLLDTLMITRNSQFGFVWFDRWNRLRLQTTRPSEALDFTDTAPAAGEFSFSSLDVHYDTENIINTVDIQAFDNEETMDENGSTDIDVVEYNYRIEDRASIKKWRRAAYKLQMFDDVELFDEVILQIIQRYSEPKVSATRMSFPVRTMQELAQATELDIYKRINIKYKDKLDDGYRIYSLTHNIVPGKTWTTEVGFGLRNESVLW